MGPKKFLCYVLMIRTIYLDLIESLCHLSHSGGMGWGGGGVPDTKDLRNIQIKIYILS